MQDLKLKESNIKGVLKVAFKKSKINNDVYERWCVVLTNNEVKEFKTHKEAQEFIKKNRERCREFGGEQK